MNRCDFHSNLAVLWWCSTHLCNLKSPQSSFLPLCPCFPPHPHPHHCHSYFSSLALPFPSLSPASWRNVRVTPFSPQLACSQLLGDSCTALTLVLLLLSHSVCSACWGHPPWWERNGSPSDRVYFWLLPIEDLLHSPNPLQTLCMSDIDAAGVHIDDWTKLVSRNNATCSISLESNAVINVEHRKRTYKYNILLHIHLFGVIVR